MAIPLISVVMSVYNAERYLRDALQSIADQTFDDFDCIIVDDGSTDDSLSIIRNFAPLATRITIISRPNTGIVGALNDGLRNARGEFIARMDADDLCHPRRFELQIEQLRADPTLVAIGSNAVAIDPEGRRLGAAPVPLTHDEIEARHLQGVSCIYHPAVMMRRSAVEQVGGYRDLCPAEDFDLWLRLGEVGRLANLPDELLTWRRTVSGLVATSTARQQAAVKKALQDAWMRRGLPGAPSIIDHGIRHMKDMYRQWAWMALRNRQRSTGRHYALRAVFADPLSLDTWRLAACAIRGY